ncbi:MAG: hypothetical protein A2451_01025 [Bdellovibrionales bacterium RIFOXYC2_FULL_39_8]|nr:MAG: hypothetical protein A2451_01025 [Bdellovibrionales bacterium RIFOXYC2_FULL_39_8]
MDPDVAKYFNGELTKLYPSYLKMVDSAVKQNFPLKASYDFKRYRPLFESIGDKQEMDGMDLAITQTGQSYCGAIKSGSLSLPFWRQFVAKFCNYFQMDISQYDSKAAKIGSVLISKLSTSTMVAMLSGIDEQAIKQHSVSAFRNSAWYHPQGVGDLEVDVVGSYGQSMSRGKESRTYEYYVKNPNTKKSELRYYNYKIDTVSQSMSLKLVAKYKLNGQKFSFQHKDSLEEESWSFPGYQAPNIDIDEQEEELTDKDSWLALQFKEYENKLSLSFKQAWVQEYCQTNSTDPSRNGMGEFVLKCMRGEDEMYSDLIDSWHLSHFGLPSKQAVELIGPYY